MGGTRVLAVWGAVVGLGAVGVGGGAAVGVGGPEAASMAEGRVDVRFTPRNHGPAAVPDAIGRLRWSEPLVEDQSLPAGCARSAVRVVLCRVRAPAADGVGERVEMGPRLRGVPSEVLLEIGTVWKGGTDRNRENDRQRVLVLDSGDEYYF